jgi:hypothetical protein
MAHGYRRPLTKKQRPAPPKAQERDPVDFAGLEARTKAFLKKIGPDDPEIAPLTQDQSTTNDAREAVIHATRKSAEAMVRLKDLFQANAEGRDFDPAKSNKEVFEEICGELAHLENNNIITAGLNSGLNEFFSMASNLYQAWNTSMYLLESDLRKYFGVGDAGVSLARVHSM